MTLFYDNDVRHHNPNKDNRRRGRFKKGWDDFLLDFAEFAMHFHGVPTFNKTKGFTAKYGARVYADRLRQFRDLRARFDPHNRLLNQFFAEHIG